MLQAPLTQGYIVRKSRRTSMMKQKNLLRLHPHTSEREPRNREIMKMECILDLLLFWSIGG